MPNTFSKYVWFIDQLDTHGRMTNKELSDAWIENGLGDVEDRAKGLSRKTLYNWRAEIIASLKILIGCETKGRAYEYYIDYSNDQRKKIREWLISTYTVINQLSSSMEVADRIILEDVPSGQKFFSTIVEAMRRNRRLEITYQGFGRSLTHTFTVEPYFVKLFHQRWYLIADNPYYKGESDSIRIYGLDRVLSVSVTEERFDMPKNFDPSFYFNQYYGTDRYSDYEEAQKVRIKCSCRQSAYWDSLPVHPSQKKLEVLPNKEVIYELELFPTFDFLQFILSQGKDVEVLEPEQFRKEVAWHIEQMNQPYKKKEE